MVLSIKNMVCNRCVSAVKGILDAMGIKAQAVTIGNATIDGNLTPQQINDLDNRLQAIGFELLRNEDDALVERIKTATIFLARRDDGKAVKLSAELPKALGRDYKSLSALFSKHEGRTIESFFIAHKVEHVKELLDYGQLTISEIAYRTGYSSVAHLSRQFRQVVGIAPSQYRLSVPTRIALDKV